jgi:hypothetical protein
MEKIFSMKHFLYHFKEYSAKVILTLLLISIYGCKYKINEYSDIENSLEGVYTCNQKTFLVPGNELYAGLYQSKKYRMVISPFGPSYLFSDKNEKIHLKAGLNVFGINPNTMKIYWTDDNSGKAMVDGPFNWILARDNKGGFSIKTGENPNYWSITYRGFNGDNYHKAIKMGISTHCTRDSKSHESTIRLIKDFKEPN